jgi:molybdenum cofactor synthesis domain-containing protein
MRRESSTRSPRRSAVNRPRTLSTVLVLQALVGCSYAYVRPARMPPSEVAAASPAVVVIPPSASERVVVIPAGASDAGVVVIPASGAAPASGEARASSSAGGVVVVAADEVEIRNALNTAVIGGVDLVISVGGTGVTPRDVAPEATGAVLDRELPGIAEALRASGVAAGSTEAGLSRGLAGISGSTLVVNLADSRAAVRDGMATLGPLAAHVIAELSNVDT